ncbi:potassium-transporting ATPase subunit C [Actinacidiphila oryziradicis]|uniref:potassium-transporting ATPase subunit C n=1 Tax=Actinacidiphila oryziradicis TaxID=2571141 RepID=UPI002AFF27BB|nr:potassium-transporting ATPase subunit C [Actinacidiphila oryziradicis]
MSAANSNLQAPRVAATRHLPPSRVHALIAAHTTPRAWGFLGERRVNVLQLNLALDTLRP